MTLAEILTLAAGRPAATLQELITAGGNAVPELRPLANEWTVKLTQAGSLASLERLLAALPGEIANIKAGRFDPHDHPSDAA